MIYYLDDVNPNYLSIYMLCGGLLIKYDQDKKSVKVCQRSILKNRFFSLLIFIYDAILYVKVLFHPKMFSKCSKNNKNYTSIYQIIPLFRQKRSKWRGKKTPTEKCIIYKTSKTIWISNVNRWNLFYSFEFGVVLGSFAMIIVIVESLYRFVLYLTSDDMILYL